MDIKLNAPEAPADAAPLAPPPAPKVEEAPVVEEVVNDAPNASDIREVNLPEGQLPGMPCDWEITLMEDGQIQAVFGKFCFHGTREEFSARLRG